MIRDAFVYIISASLAACALAGVIWITLHARNKTTREPITYLFSHGLADTYKQVFRYTRHVRPDGTIDTKPYLFEGPVVTFNFPDAHEGPLRVNFTKTSLGQSNEVQHLAQMYHQTHERLDSRLVLFGLSRGASTTLNFMAMHNPPNVHALVLESPFDSTDTIVQSMLKKAHLSNIPGSHTIGKALISSVFFKHNAWGLQPIKSAPAIRKNLPIFIACSLEDGLIPAQSTMRLYLKLRETGHDNVYLFIAETGQHSEIINADDAHDYQHAVHAFYKEYNLPHNSEFAALGKKNLQTCQPTEQDLAKYLQN